MGSAPHLRAPQGECGHGPLWQSGAGAPPRECAALLAAARTRRLDRVRIPHQPLDVLAQQVVAEVAAQDWDEQELFDCLRRVWPYCGLPRATFDQVLQMLADGFSTRVRQYQLPYPGDTVGPGAGGRRKRLAAQHPLLVRRGAGAR